MRPHPLICVTDVERSSRWYQSLLGCRSGHGGAEYERLIHDDKLVMQLHRFDVEHHHGRLGDPSSRPYGNGLALWFEIEDFDDAVRRAESLDAEVVLRPHRNPSDGPGGPAHREIWLRDPDGYLVVLASPDGESPWPDPRVGQ
jgi:catechol 2,3-dioxygenase-like lactoylglutathione lyase family enzyme